MADFCKDCADKIGFVQDFNRNEQLEEGYGYWELCEGCGWVFVDGYGNVLDREPYEK